MIGRWWARMTWRRHDWRGAKRCEAEGHAKCTMSGRCVHCCIHVMCMPGFVGD